MNFQDINASASPEVQMNENFETIEHSSVYGKRQPVTTGLTWGYYGGRWSGYAVAQGTLSLTNTATNYVVVARSTGVISTSTASTNWDNTKDYARVYKLTTAGGIVTATEDHRAGLYGVHGSASAGMFGKHSIPIMAAAMRPSTTNGCAPLATVEISAGQPDLNTLDFDTTTQEHAQFSVQMPKSWDEGAVTYKIVWSHAATATNFGVAFDLAGVAVSNDDAIGTAFGTAQRVTDTGGTTNDLYVSPESSAITIAGTPAAEDHVFFRLSRVPSDGADTLAIDARVHAVILYVTINAENDA